MSNPILKREKNPKGCDRAYAYFDVGGKKQKVRFGKWGDGKEPLPEAQEKFNRTLVKYLSTQEVPVPKTTDNVTVAMLVAEYLEKVKPMYMKNGKTTAHYYNIELVTDRLLDNYASMPTDKFDSAELIAFQEALIHSRRTPDHVPTKNTKPLCTKTVNEYVNIIRHMFKWGVPRKFVKGAISYELSSVESLQDGESGSAKSKIVESASRDDVFTTVAASPKMIGDMIQVQYWCAMRSEGVRYMRACDIDTTGDIWIYAPHQHKTEKAGKNPPIPIAPEARELLLPYIKEKEEQGSLDTYLFNPADAARLRSQELRQKRQSKIQPSQQKRQANAPGRKYHPYYTKDAYSNAIDRAIKKAGVPAWSSHQLRHLRATEVYEDHGEDAVMILLGHSNINVTRRYIDAHIRTKVQKEAARDVMRKISQSKNSK